MQGCSKRGVIEAKQRGGGGGGGEFDIHGNIGRYGKLSDSWKLLYLTQFFLTWQQTWVYSFPTPCIPINVTPRLETNTPIAYPQHRVDP